MRDRYFIGEAGNTGPKNRIFQAESERNDKSCEGNRCHF